MLLYPKQEYHKKQNNLKEVEFSLNKKKRWLLPDMVKEKIVEYDFDSMMSEVPGRSANDLAWLVLYSTSFLAIEITTSRSMQIIETDSLVQTGKRITTRYIIISFSMIPIRAIRK